ncbi:MAG: hypothetical protein ACKESC_01810 [Candidatus Hodgkinia cicadicola]
MFEELIYKLLENSSIIMIRWSKYFFKTSILSIHFSFIINPSLGR